MIANARNLQIKLVRGRTKTLSARVGTYTVTYPPASGGPANFTFNPTDITLWWFSFTMRTNYTYQQPQIALTKNPIQNMGDPTQGWLIWQVLAVDTEPLATGNYVFDVSVTLSDLQPQFFCGGISSLADNVTDPVTIPTTI
jgi:hypothetical protein